MKKRLIEYPAVLYYEKHPLKDETQVSITFPDLISLGYPASTAGSDKEDAIEAARDILDIVLDMAADLKQELPKASRIDRVDIRLDEELEIIPHQIEIVRVKNIA